MVEIMISYAMSLVGVPYMWGGNNPLEGLDCSGFAIEVIRSVEHIPRDMTAQTLYQYLAQIGWEDNLARGSILFFGKSKTDITHVEIALNDKVSIGASGGDESTLDYDDAIEKSAFVKIRPFRKDLVAVLSPSFL